MPAVCEPAQNSSFFGRTFVGVISIGLIFLLSEGDQQKLLTSVASSLEPGGRFLFSSPHEACRWSDTLTGRASMSLGADAYAAHLLALGCGWTTADPTKAGTTITRRSNPSDTSP
ncbi:hypothetical protein [Sphingomonas melonis]